jgi:tetratricopeptide (TPR) repeat protein
LRSKIDALLKSEKYEESEKLVGDLEKIGQSPLEKQYVFFCRGLIAMRWYRNYEVASKLLKKALKITLSKLDADIFNSHILTCDEIIIICMLAEVKYAMNYKEDALNYLHGLLNLMFGDHILCLSSDLPIYVMFELAHCLNLEKEYRKSIEICENALEYCSLSKSAVKVDDLLRLKASNLKELGEEAICAKILVQLNALEAIMDSCFDNDSEKSNY